MKSNMAGMRDYYGEMYKTIGKWGANPPKAVEDDKGYYFYMIGWWLSGAPYHCWTGEKLGVEYEIRDKVIKAWGALMETLEEVLDLSDGEKADKTFAERILNEWG